MKLSAFNLYVDDFPDPGETLIHNTFSGAYVVLSNQAVSALRQLERGATLSASERALINISELAEADVGVLVRCRDDEQREYRSWLDEQRARAGMRAIVAINRACNFACEYCCQADILNGTVMPPAVLTQTANWLATRAVEVDTSGLHLTFVGGEPLLHPGRIKTLVTEIREQLDHRDVEVTIGLITNGYFLTEEMVQSLRSFGLVGAQVTLDGDETTHCQSRIAKSGEDTFQRIFDNVITASRHIRIAINGNYREDTVAGFGPLIGKLAGAGFPVHNKISFSPALEILGAPAGSGAGACTWSESAHSYRIPLYDQILRHGYSTSPLHVVGPCAFYQSHMYAIDVDGVIYKCPGFLGHPEWGIGVVESGLTARYEQMLAVDTSGTCGGCAHQPNCGGGCLASAFLRAGTMDAIYCEFDYFEAVKEQALMREYLLTTSDNTEQAVAVFPAPPIALPAVEIPQQPGRGVRSSALQVIQ